MLTNIKSSADPTTRVITLQELGELLSTSTEDTLTGSFQVDTFLRKLVKILDLRLTTTTEMTMMTVTNQTRMLNLLLPLLLAEAVSIRTTMISRLKSLQLVPSKSHGVTHTVVYHGAILVLCSKLIKISYTDLAEQTLSVRPASLCHCVYLQMPP